MQNRREFLKKVGLVGAVAASGAVAANADENLNSGKIKKTEVHYKRSKNWELYYKQAK